MLLEDRLESPINGRFRDKESARQSKRLIHRFRRLRRFEMFSLRRCDMFIEGERKEIPSLKAPEGSGAWRYKHVTPLE